ncbi:MAG: PKD domain-containing protein [Saprospiraceae bacterium]
MVKSDYITISPSPTASFTIAANGPQVTFTNTGQNGTSFSWSFGDGNTSTQTNPVHTYTDNGVYTITETVTNACGSVSSTQSITIAQPPTATFTSAMFSPFCADNLPILQVILPIHLHHIYGHLKEVHQLHPPRPIL